MSGLYSKCGVKFSRLATKLKICSKTRIIAKEHAMVESSGEKENVGKLDRASTLT